MPRTITPKQSRYLNDLISKVAAREGTSERDVQQSLGLIEANAWGGRLRSEAITPGNVSRWIGELQSRKGRL